ncbi:helix-turn-helix transcriptional regulator [Bradyrhizobium sp. KB893862 SZCCT0404]|uniref:helix-turn-helix domain-containing protein n=1 Tax=Bradyrhizobium sp. KB893862 SZCCT0404 TaxID=2807672 RepID=UPI001BA8DFAA|nr:XRE family transcriptional regulator [Bradyrhizobium sp. KB893862 SZCCT0404]MBR1175228.1 helix-turn-helix transcriptional regulator [Bradyrhizobium sp. KB893862 SZCCT0404]
MSEREPTLLPLAADRDQSVKISGIVKTLRKRAGLTLAELAERSGVSTSTISKIETGQLLPGYEVILGLSIGLGVEVAELFRMNLTEAPTGRRGVTRSGAGAKYNSPRYVYEALAPDVSKKHFLPLVATVKARSVREFGRLPSHEGEEFVYVLSGSVRLYSEHYEPLELDAGDSAYFDSRSGHALISTSPDDATVVWVCSDIDALRVSTREPS